MKKVVCLVLSFVVALAFLVGCSAESPQYLIGLVKFINLGGGDVKKAELEIRDYIPKFESVVAVDVEGSDIKKINDAEAGEKIIVGEIANDMLQYALKMYKSTQGAFNIASFPATMLWKFSAFDDVYDVKRTPPNLAEITAVLDIIDLEESFDIGDGYVVKKKAGAMLDLGGIAKGYLADKCLEIAEKNGVTSGIIDISSNLVLIGRHAEGRKYVIGISAPRNEIDYICSLALEDIAVATSGDYERYFMYEGKRYCHIIDSNTASPINNGIMSVTIINESSMICDVYSTTGFVLGVEKSLEFFNEQNIKSIILFERDGAKYIATTGGVEYTGLHGDYNVWIG